MSKIIKRVFSKSKANDLISMGNTLLKTEKDYIKPKREIYIFERTDKLIKDLSALHNIYIKNKTIGVRNEKYNSGKLFNNS